MLKLSPLVLVGLLQWWEMGAETVPGNEISSSIHVSLTSCPPVSPLHRAGERRRGRGCSGGPVPAGYSHRHRDRLVLQSPLVPER